MYVILQDFMSAFMSGLHPNYVGFDDVYVGLCNYERMAANRVGHYV